MPDSTAVRATKSRRMHIQRQGGGFLPLSLSLSCSRGAGDASSCSLDAFYVEKFMMAYLSRSRRRRFMSSSITISIRIPVGSSCSRSLVSLVFLRDGDRDNGARNSRNLRKRSLVAESAAIAHRHRDLTIPSSPFSPRRRYFTTRRGCDSPRRS